MRKNIIVKGLSRTFSNIGAGSSNTRVNSRSTEKGAGFTLIEILVVIGIIAILAAVVLIAINPRRQFQQANDSQRTSNVNSILNAIGQYMADHKGDLPNGIPPLAVPPVDITVNINNTDLTAAFCDDILPEYMPALPTDPRLNVDDIEQADCAGAWDTGYVLVHRASGRITVRATGEITNPIEVTR